MATQIQANVLLVDDEEKFLEALSQRLESRGLKVEAVTSGEEAVRQTEKKNFDAIILDLAMPGLDGIETLRRIKEQRADLEMIMLTGHATINNAIDAMKLGAEDFLEKPVDLTMLMEKISEAKHKRALVLEKQHEDEIKQIIKSKSW
jgi:DNA-binding NtrC family response regulator